jgi:D-cysteine desulfhydrase
LHPFSRRAFNQAALLALWGCARDSRRSPQAATSAPPSQQQRPNEPLPSPPTDPSVEVAPTREPSRALFDAHPSLKTALPFTRLADLPTPIDHATALGKHLGLEQLYIKRDDQSGALYGGGKTRKLEFLLGEALQQNAKTVLTFGAAGSNQAVATAAYAQQLGLKSILLLLPQPVDSRVVRNLTADLHFGATVRTSPNEGRAEAAGRRVARELGDLNPYVIPTGGSTPLGNVAFVNAAFELALDVKRGALPEPDFLYLPIGTMGSAVGLCIGLAALGLKTHVVAVRASSPATSSEAHMRSMISKTVQYLRALDASFPVTEPATPTVRTHQLGRGYAIPTKEGLAAMELARDLAGLSLEPTYSAKAMAALVEDAPGLRDKVVLFWTTHSSRPLDFPAPNRRDIPADIAGYFSGSG